MRGGADTLVLNGEFGHAALVQDLEASFGVSLPFTEHQMWYFVGDIYRSLVVRLGPGMEGGHANAGTLAYYHLRRGIRESDAATASRRTGSCASWRHGSRAAS